MTHLPIARELLSSAPPEVADMVLLDYDARLMRRKKLIAQGGVAFLVDLAEVTNLDDHWGFLLEDGRAVGVEAAAEDLIEVGQGEFSRANATSSLE